MCIQVGFTPEKNLCFVLNWYKPRKNMCPLMFSLKMQLFASNTSLHQNLGVSYRWQLERNTHCFLPISSTVLFYVWDSGSKTRDLRWYIRIQESFPCFTTGMGGYISLYIFKCTNILAYTIIYICTCTNSWLATGVQSFHFRSQECNRRTENSHRLWQTSWFHIILGQEALTDLTC